jgi:hypothetical protein
LEKLTNLLDWCKGERERLQRQLEMLKSGQFHIGENRGMGWVDISSQSIERVTVAVSELDRLCAESLNASKRSLDGLRVHGRGERTAWKSAMSGGQPYKTNTIRPEELPPSALRDGLSPAHQGEPCRGGQARWP